MLNKLFAQFYIIKAWTRTRFLQRFHSGVVRWFLQHLYIQDVSWTPFELLIKNHLSGHFPLIHKTNSENLVTESEKPVGVLSLLLCTKRILKWRSQTRVMQSVILCRYTKKTFTLKKLVEVNFMNLNFISPESSNCTKLLREWNITMTN